MGQDCSVCCSTEVENSEQVSPVVLFAENSEHVPPVSLSFAEKTLRDFTEFGPLLEVLRSDSVVLVRATWAVGHAGLPSTMSRSRTSTPTNSEPMPRRQDLPLDATWAVDCVEVDAEKCLESIRSKYYGKALCIPIIVCSYCWLSQWHPDPENKQLNILAAYLKIFLGYFCKYLTENYELGIFLDWVSMHQKPRTDNEQAQFEVALSSVNMWYGNCLTWKVLLTCLPEGVDRAPYDDSGWPSFEKAVSWMISPVDAVFDAQDFDASMHTTYTDVHRISKKVRLPPPLPDEFATSLEAKVVTNGSDKIFLAKKYEETFRVVLASAVQISWALFGWGNAEMIQVAKVLPHATSLEKLNLSDNAIGDQGVELLSEALIECRKFANLVLNTNRGITCSGIESLAVNLPSMKNLQFLALADIPMGDGGASALAKVLPTTSVKGIELGECGIGDDGARNLARALTENSCLVMLELGGNRISDVGVQEFIKALPQASSLNFLALHDMKGSGISGNAKSELRSAWKACQPKKPDKHIYPMDGFEVLDTPFL